MNALLTAIALWLSANFGLPATHDLPHVEHASAIKMADLRYKGLARLDAQPTGGPVQPGRREVVAVYDDATRTIYLQDGWNADTPADLSVLVHEMVHHLQNIGELKFECPQERERVAYQAQERWLGLFGRDLQQDFEIDPFTLLVSTKCLF
jgi:hypothetical protein